MVDVIKGAVNLYNKMLEGRDPQNSRVPPMIQRDIYRASLSSHSEFKAQKAPMLTVRSNYARGRAVVINNGELILTFDNEGIAKLPSHLRHVLDVEMTHRPGRYQVLEETVDAPVIEATPEPVVEEKVEEVEIKPVLEDTTEVAEDTRKIRKSKTSKEK